MPPSIRKDRPFPPPPRSPLSPLPQDVDKPGIPYSQGQKFTVFGHIPPPPLGKPYSNFRSTSSRECRQRLTQFQCCLSAPPQEGTTKYEEVRSFIITSELAVRDGRGAQIVVVDDNLVAKIYDPLYYPTYIGSTSIRNDVVGQAERDYSREAAAYEELNDRFGGSIIPKYHGSWTWEVPSDGTSGPTKRSVRLVLMEFIQGVNMYNMDPEQLSEEAKSNIMVKSIDVFHAVLHYGVNHRDFAPRNLICSGSDLESPSLRVVLVDFNTSIVLRFAPFPRAPAKLPLSPISVYWGGGPHEFPSGWVPSPVAKRQQWLWKQWGDSPLYRLVARGKEGPPERLISPLKQTK